MHFSPSTGGFYHADLHPTLPADAVEITAARHRQLLDAQATGRTIVAGEGGRPVLAPAATLTLDRLHGRAVAAVRAEARRRTSTIASPDQQAADTSAIALYAVALGTELFEADFPAEAVARAQRVAHVREAAAKIEAEIAEMPRHVLPFDAAVILSAVELGGDVVGALRWYHTAVLPATGKTAAQLVAAGDPDAALDALLRSHDSVHA